MGIADWLVNRKARALMPEFASEIGKMLAGLPDGVMSEAKFRNATMDVLRAFDDIELKREAGVQGTGTRIDIYAHVFQHDVLITIKKGLSEQKIKKVIGEINVFLDRWKPRIQGNATYVYLLVFGVKDANELEALNAYEDFAIRVFEQTKGAFVLNIALAGSAVDDD